MRYVVVIILALACVVLHVVGAPKSGRYRQYVDAGQQRFQWSLNRNGQSDYDDNRISLNGLGDLPQNKHIGSGSFGASIRRRRSLWPSFMKQIAAVLENFHAEPLLVKNANYHVDYVGKHFENKLRGFQKPAKVMLREVDEERANRDIVESITTNEENSRSAVHGNDKTVNNEHIKAMKDKLLELIKLDTYAMHRQIKLSGKLIARDPSMSSTDQINLYYYGVLYAKSKTDIINKFLDKNPDIKESILAEISQIQNLRLDIHKREKSMTELLNLNKDKIPEKDLLEIKSVLRPLIHKNKRWLRHTWEPLDKMLSFSKLSDKAYTPIRGSQQAAGYDLKSAYQYTVKAHGKELIKTDLQIAVPPGTYGRIAPRSGLAWKNFIDVGAGVIDRDYRGNVCILLINHSDVDFIVQRGDRVAQLICEKIVYPELNELPSLDETERGVKGFGSSG